MQIDVVSMSMAERFNPKVPTLAIRIFSTPNFRRAPRRELDYRDKFTHVL
ncbi:MAG: hypothetical protein AABX11_00395 [Nanoarchaeota archaeon]